jgi:hypothetical protein
MTVKTFWTILIKILGIWLVLESLTIIPRFILTLFYSYPKGTTQGFAITLSMLLLIMGVYLFILRLFVFKTSWLIDKLQLDKGFEEEKIDLNIQLSTVLTVATIVVGGLMFVDSLTQLCKETFVFFQQKNLFLESQTSAWIIFNLVKSLLGYLLMTNSKKVVVFINNQTAKQNENDE